MKKILFSVAESKGEYASRMESIKRRYEGVTEDFESELVADLIGDYLFKDEDFVRRLSTENRNVFQKIYDEIKYLLKLATAGSKEARQLEKVKRIFEKIYREGAKGVEGTKNAIESMDGKLITVIDTQNDTRSLSAAQKYLKTLVNADKPFATILADAQPVYIGKDLPGEYRGSKYTQGMRSYLRNVKMQAATNLDEMLLLAENGKWQENFEEKHNKDAQNGWYRYPTEFAVPILNVKKEIDHYNIYSGTLLIRNDADGKSYLYDMIPNSQKNTGC